MTALKEILFFLKIMLGVLAGMVVLDIIGWCYALFLVVIFEHC